jgi:hypothetical protein
MRNRVLGMIGVAGIVLGSVVGVGAATAASAAPNPGSVAGGPCGPPGAGIKTVTPNPNIFYGQPPGQVVKATCLPQH